MLGFSSQHNLMKTKREYSNQTLIVMTLDITDCIKEVKGEIIDTFMLNNFIVCTCNVFIDNYQHL